MWTVKRTSIAMILLTLVFAIMPDPSDAQGYTTVRPGGRGGNWEFYLPLSFADSATINGQGGSSADINADWGFGFGAGYNVNDHFQVNGMINWNSRSYVATYVTTTPTEGTGKYSNYMDTSTLSLNGVYYLLNGDITPFVSVGVGITYVDTNIQTGPGSTYCWYDWVWGYVCTSSAPTKTENDISYNAGIGVRFDVNRQFSLQGSYNKTWIDFSKASGTPDFDSWRMDLIFRM